MKFTLPITPRYAWPLLLSLLLLDFAVATAVWVTLNRMVDNTSVRRVDGFACLTYSAPLGKDHLYLMTGCRRVSEK